MELVGPVHDWFAQWQAFRHSHSAWAAGFPPGEPVYCLPRPAIDQLALPRGTSPPVLDAPAAAAERDFTGLCRRHPAVGCWRDSPVIYGPLTPPPPEPTPELMRLLNWPRAEQLQLRGALEAAREAALRRKGVPGWLLTEPAYLGQVDDLAARWRALPEARRPPFPLGRALAVPAPPEGSRRAGPVVADFAAALGAFLDRWGLAGLATWDLPDPQGPLLPNLFPAGAPATPAHGVHLVVPLHYPLQGDDGLLRQVFDCQRQAARELGVDESLAGLPHHQAYATLFDVLHLERAIRARLTGRPRPPGLVSRVEAAVAAGLGVSTDAVIKSRKAIAACLRGERARVGWLRPRNR
jgi:hypothetical protein